MKRILKKLSKKTILGILALVIIGLPLLYLTLLNSKSASAAWFDDSWLYRKAIPVTNNTTAQNNVYIAVTVDTSSTTSFQAHCEDVRFTKQNGELLPYYLLTDNCRSGNSVFHVQFDTFPAGSQTIYVYYGNPSANKGSTAADFSTVASNYTVGSIAAEEKSPGPVAYWKFDDGTGTTTQDSTFNNADGTLSGATLPTWQTEDQCVSGKCLFFDGATSNVGIGTSVGNVQTISMWVRPNTTASTALIDFDGGTHKITTNASSVISATGFTSPTYYVNGIRTATPTLVANTWQHLAITTGTGFNTLANFSIAKSSATFFKGYIDDVKIYAYARTTAQVKTDYASAKAGSGTNKGTSVAMGAKTQEYLSNGLVGYWKMDEASGTLADSSGNGSTGTWAGTGTSHYTTGKFGNGGGFNGTNDVVSVADSNALNVNAAGNITISAWVRRVGNSQYSNPMSIVSKRNIGGSGPGFEFMAEATSSCNTGSDGNLLCFLISDGTNAYRIYTSNTLTADSVWHHVVAVLNRTNENNTLIFMDGIPQSVTRVGTLSSVGDITFNYPLCIGKPNEVTCAAGSLNGFNGNIDEVRIYNRALSPKEVSDLYNWAPGPVGYWKMDEKSGQTVSDSSGNGITATLTNSPSWITGKYGGGLKLNGTNQYLSVTSSLSTLTFNRNFTLEAWINVGDASNNPPILSQDAYGNWLFYVTTDNTIKLNSRNVAGVVTSNSALSLNSWHHVAVTIDSNDTANVNMYIDGVLDKTATTTASFNTSGAANVYLGSYDSTPNGPLNGSLDEVKIYNYARTQKQIVSDMNAGHPAVGSPVGSAVGYWKFDEGNSTVANNSGNGGSTLNGTLTSMATAPSTATSGWTNSGKFGKALNFDGNNDVVDFGNDSKLNLSLPFSISLWIKRANTDTGVFIAKTNSYWAMFNGNNIRFSFNNGTNCDSTTSTSFSSTTQWYHLVGTYESGSQKIYVNGVLQPLSEGGTCTGTVTTNSNNLGIGAPNPTWPFAGSIDEVKIYNYSLTSDEVKTEFNHGQGSQMGALGTNSTYQAGAANQEYCVPGDTTSCAAPVGRWDFDEGFSTTVNDTSGNGNTGTWAGSSAHYVTGKLGKGGNVRAGNGDSVTVTSPNNFPSTANAPWTLETWIKTSSFSSYPIIMIYGSGDTGTSPHLAIASNVFRAACFGEGSNVDGSTTISNNTWYHIAGVFNGSTLSLYVNGKLDAGPTAIITCTPIATNLIIGSGSGGSLTAVLDNTRIFNYARSAAQIAWDYNKGAPVGWWKFNECSGLVAHNSISHPELVSGSLDGTINIGTEGGTGHQDSAGTCTAVDATTAWYNGAIGKRNASLNFDGIDDYVTIASDINVTNWRGLTVSAWVNPSQIPNWPSGLIVSKNDSEDDGYGSSVFGLAINSSGYPTFHLAQRLDAGEGTWGTITSSKTISISQWSHLVGVWNQNNTYLYLNGVQVASGGGGAGYLSNVCGSLAIGARACGTVGGNRFFGQLDDVKIFNYALTGTQVKNEYNGGAINFAPATGSP